MKNRLCLHLAVLSVIYEMQKKTNEHKEQVDLLFQDYYFDSMNSNLCRSFFTLVI